MGDSSDEENVRQMTSVENQADDDDALFDDIVVPATQAAQTKKKSKKPTKYNWSTEAIDALIKEWEARPLLFDCSHKEYHLKDKRKLAIEQIREKLSSDHLIEPPPTADDIQKKIHNLRTYFNAERNKEESSKSSGKGADDVYHSSWQFFVQLAFLNDNVAPRTTHSNLRKLDRTTDEAQPHSKKSRSKVTVIGFLI